MSLERNDYVILGYDLTIYMDTIYDDWSEDEENIDKWECNQKVGEIQLFSDPMSGDHLYFGYIVSGHNEWDPDVVATVSLEDMLIIKPDVDDKLYETRMDINGIVDQLEYRVICFTEWR